MWGVETHLGGLRGYIGEHQNGRELRATGSILREEKLRWRLRGEGTFCGEGKVETQKFGGTHRRRITSGGPRIEGCAERRDRIEGWGSTKGTWT